MTKYVISGLLATLMTFSLVVAPAFASTTSRFELLDADHDGHITTGEFDSRGCKLKPGIIKYMDENGNGTIERGEFAFNFSLVRSCK